MMEPIDRSLHPGEPKWLGIRDTALDAAETEKKKAKAKVAAKGRKANSKSKQGNRGGKGQRLRNSGVLKSVRVERKDFLDLFDELGDEEQLRKAPEGIFVQAFDLGTTFSTAAYAVPSEEPGAESVRVVKDWDKAPYPGHTEKTPTAIAFRTETENVDLKGNEWGYAIGKGRKRTVWFKLRFAAGGNPKELDDPLLQQSIGAELTHLPQGMSEEDVLKEMYRLLSEKCHKHAREKSGLTKVEEMPTVTVITVPAEYGEAKKKRMREIVEEAIQCKNARHEIKIITESQAVLYGTMQDCRRTGDMYFRKGECASVLDIGGGSVDAATGVITRLNPPQFVEACNPGGAYCGATSVCRHFVKWCGCAFGTAYKAVALEHRTAGSRFIGGFEDRMKAFDNRDEEELFQVQLPQLAAELLRRGITSHDKYDFEEGSVRFNAAEMRSFFEDMIRGALQTMHNQIQEFESIRRRAPRKSPSEIKTLILAGGCAQCEYVCQVFRDFCQNQLQGRVRLVVPSAPWSSVVSGAVLAGLFPHMLQFRTSSFCIGVTVTQAFDDTNDKLEDLYMCQARGRRAKGYIEWLFQRGDSFKPGAKKVHTVSLAIHRSEETVRFHMNLYTYDGHLENGKPDRIDDPGVRLFAEVEGSFRPPKTFWKHRTSHATLGQVETVDVKFWVALDGGQGVFNIEAKIGKTLVKDLQVEFEAEAYR